MARHRGREPHGWVAALVGRLEALPDGEIAPTARRAGMAERALRRIRRGENADIRVSPLEKLALALGESASEMLCEEKRTAQKMPSQQSYDIALRIRQQLGAMQDQIEAGMRRARKRD